MQKDARNISEKVISSAGCNKTHAPLHNIVVVVVVASSMTHRASEWSSSDFHTQRQRKSWDPLTSTARWSALSVLGLSLLGRSGLGEEASERGEEGEACEEKKAWEAAGRKTERRRREKRRRGRGLTERGWTEKGRSEGWGTRYRIAIRALVQKQRQSLWK